MVTRQPVCRNKHEEGQATVEYVLLLAVIIGFYLIVAQGIARSRVGERLVKPLTEQFAFAYKYGHPGARGYDEGTPKNHPRIWGGEGNFRLFINPKKR